MTEQEQITKALQLINEATGGATNESGLIEAVVVLISQRDNARHYANVFREKLRENGEIYI